ncbi:MAG: glycoside-pentoside-hexuronide (GPH):cation symporter [Lachnospiraceae bacterium]|nr:glycoside-pentoside-hexuronide (GPH):cation symporter [Lachnospiraceae bacterium]
MAKKDKPYGVTSGGEKLAYALGDLGSNFVWTFCSSWLTLYYTDSVLMSAAMIGTIMLVLRLFDGVSDIIFGALIEKTRTKMGKARPWFGASIIPLVIIQILVYNVPSGMSAGGKTAWIVITYFLLTVVAYTINNLSYHSMLSRFSLDAEDRNKVSSVRGIFAFLAGLLLSILTPIVLNGNGGSKEQHAWTVTALVFSIACLVLQGITFLVVKEKISCFDDENEKQEKKGDLKVGISALLSTKYFYISIIVFICTYILNGLVLAAHVYFSRDVLGNGDLYSIIAVASVFSTIIGIAVAPKMFKKIGKRRALITGSVIYIVGCVIGLIGSTQLSMVLAATVVTGIGLAPYVAGIFTFAPDIVDLLELQTKERYEGLVTSVNSVGIKVGTGLASASLGWGLALGHYDGALEVQAASVLTAETVLIYGLPIVMCIICLIAMSFWDIDKKLNR